jgi:hypothetical protein
MVFLSLPSDPVMIYERTTWQYPGSISNAQFILLQATSVVTASQTPKTPTTTRTETSQGCYELSGAGTSSRAYLSVGWASMTPLWIYDGSLISRHERTVRAIRGPTSFCQGRILICAGKFQLTGYSALFKILYFA